MHEQHAESQDETVLLRSAEPHGQRLRALRAQWHWTRDELAVAIGRFVESMSPRRIKERIAAFETRNAQHKALADRLTQLPAHVIAPEGWSARPWDARLDSAAKREQLSEFLMRGLGPAQVTMLLKSTPRRLATPSFSRSTQMRLRNWIEKGINGRSDQYVATGLLSFFTAFYLGQSLPFWRLHPGEGTSVQQLVSAAEIAAHLAFWKLSYKDYAKHVSLPEDATDETMNHHSPSVSNHTIARLEHLRLSFCFAGLPTQPDTFWLPSETTLQGAALFGQHFEVPHPGSAGRTAKLPSLDELRELVLTTQPHELAMRYARWQRRGWISFWRNERDGETKLDWQSIRGGQLGTGREYTLVKLPLFPPPLSLVEHADKLPQMRALAEEGCPEYAASPS